VYNRFILFLIQEEAKIVFKEKYAYFTHININIYIICRLLRRWTGKEKKTIIAFLLLLPSLFVLVIEHKKNNYRRGGNPYVILLLCIGTALLLYLPICGVAAAFNVRRDIVYRNARARALARVHSQCNYTGLSDLLLRSVFVLTYVIIACIRVCVCVLYSLQLAKSAHTIYSLYIV